jgi:hypothetical protein
MKKKKIYLLMLFALILTAMPAMSGCAPDRVLGIIPAGVFYPVKILSVSPANGAADVSTNVVVKASFNEALDALSFNRGTFLLIGPDGHKVQGKVYYNPNSLTSYIATFTPLEPLRPNTEYTTELTTGIMGNLKQHLAKNYVWRFTTGN